MSHKPYSYVPKSVLSIGITNKDFVLFGQVEVTINTIKPMAVGIESYANSANICQRTIWNF
jgi:hypothetical protein